MNKEVCKRFKNIWEWISDELIERNDQYNDFGHLNNNCNHNNFLNNYSCNNNNFKSDLDKISAGCLYLLDQFYKDCGVAPSPGRNNINIVDYILIWLSYMLNLGKSKEEDNIKDFYKEYIYDCDKYNKGINELTDYDSYKDLIDTKMDVLNMDINIVSKFYKAFKSLCEMYNELDNENNDCKNYLEDDNEFDKKYKELKNDSDIPDKSPYKEILSTLSTDYDNFKKECEVISSPPSAETKEDPGKTLVHSFGEGSEEYLVQDFTQYSELDSEPNSDVASSSSSIVSKLIPVLLIFGAISIFLGISYKVNNKELKNDFHYIYSTLTKKSYVS
ncbi:putative yir2 protein [Plasmodium yoelii yoelii]|uniref:Yir2 protein n=1 Tax=Plasmodium yoelii yoelii TaxID=73239 RepID=Q7R9C8_PLAYO|nr:putative yir2 protein [Plasmodium yoelii yoelii]